jgi:hypothetical protein
MNVMLCGKPEPRAADDELHASSTVDEFFVDRESAGGELLGE